MREASTLPERPPSNGQEIFKRARSGGGTTHPDVSAYRDDNLVGNAWREIVARLTQSNEDEIDKIFPGLPAPTHRPLLTAAMLIELAERDDKQMPLSELVNGSRISKIHRLPYAALHLPDLIEELGGKEEIDIDALYSYFCGPESHGTKPINSSLRNALLARELNKTVLRDSKYEARLGIAEYTWASRLSAVHNQDVPDLPKGFENSYLAKFVVTIVDKDKPAERLVFFDYGEAEGDERRATGEDLSMMSLWTKPLIDPENSDQLREGLQYIADRQGGETGKVSIEILNKSQKLIDAVESQALKEALPATLSAVEDLSESQIDSLYQISRQIMDMWQIYAGSDDLSYQRVVPWKDMMTVLVQMKQPSTRTVLAAMTAAQSVGLSPFKLDQSDSSQAKGELPASERITFSAQNIGAILSRDSEFEERTEILGKNPDSENDPIRISLGGNRHHPSQTLAELATFMEEFGCSTLAELREKTDEHPPTIMFIGHVNNKRADRSLIEFLAKHLPQWQIKVLVPADKYIPVGLDLPYNSRYEARTNDQLTDQSVLTGLTNDVDFVYIANAEGTAGDDGKGEGAQAPDYHLSRSVIETNNIKVLAPLPASGELDPQILDSKHHGRLIRRTIEYKNSVLAAALLLTIAGRKHKAEKGNSTRIDT